MQTGVYGSGYLGTVVSACLADFGTPVTCCHPDSSRMVEMAQGNVPFFEKNLTEVIKRNVRSGRLAYSTDMESFARKAQVIFLAEDTPQHLADLAIRIARLAPQASHSHHHDAGAGRDRHQCGEAASGCRTEGHHRIATGISYSGLRRGRFQLARPDHPGHSLERRGAGAQIRFFIPW